MTDTPNASEADRDITAGSAEWLWYATGSKVPAMMGVSKFTTRLGLWRQMTGKEPSEPSNAYMEHGNTREPIIREGTSSALGRDILTPRMLVGNTNPRHAYSPDGLVLPGGFTPLQLWECKAPQDISGWGEPSTDQIDAQYYPQVQWGLYVTGLDSCMVTLEPHRDFVPLYTADYFVPRNDDYIAEMVATVDEFLSHVDDDTEPPPLRSIVIDDSNDLRVVRRWARRNKLRLLVEKALAEDRPTVDKLGENALALMTTDGEVLCHWSETEKAIESVDWASVESAATSEQIKAAQVRRLDRERFREVAPALVQEHTTTSTKIARRLSMGAAK